MIWLPVIFGYLLLGIVASRLHLRFHPGDQEDVAGLVVLFWPVQVLVEMFELLLTVVDLVNSRLLQLARRLRR